MSLQDRRDFTHASSVCFPVPYRRHRTAATAVAARLPGSARRIKNPYADMPALPTNVAIDRPGVVRHATAGAFDLDELNALLVPLLKETA